MVINMKKILVLNGPNLNMTGIRKKNVYGGETLKQINDELKLYGKANGEIGRASGRERVYVRV